jgi:hypothetical protein
MKKLQLIRYLNIFFNKEIRERFHHFSEQSRDMCKVVDIKQNTQKIQNFLNKLVCYCSHTTDMVVDPFRSILDPSDLKDQGSN